MSVIIIIIFFMTIQTYRSTLQQLPVTQDSNDMTYTVM